MKVIPTVFEKEFLKAEKRIENVKKTAEWIQIDVADGVFCFGKTFELELLSKTDNLDNNLLDIHLMVKEPINWVNKCLFVQASRMVGQVEMMSDRDEFIKTVKDAGMEAGLAFDVDTEVTGIIPAETEVVLLMARKAGFGKFQFDNNIYRKVRKLIKTKNDNNLKFLIGVDGGIDKKQADILIKSGADMIYSGSNYFDLIND